MFCAVPFLSTETAQTESSTDSGKTISYLNKPEILYRPFISSNRYRRVMDMSMSANFALSSTFIKDRTFYNISEDAIEALCIDPGFVPLDISKMKGT